MQQTRTGCRRWALVCGLCLAAWAAGTVQAEEPPRWHKWRLREWPGKQPVGRGGGVHSYERAGYPNEVSKYAVPTNGPNYEGYSVGGGSPGMGKGGRYPEPDEGTWGWDYGGWSHKFRFKVALFWNNRYQGGTGAYKIDGPPVKDVGPLIAELKYEPPGSHHLKKHHEHAEEHE